MFKKIKNNEVYKKYKEDPEKRFRLSLAFWGILFLIIILITRFNFTGGHTYENDELKVKSYEYVYYNNVNKIFGSYYNGRNCFIIDNNKYYYDGEDVYSVFDHDLKVVNLEMGLLRIDVDFIESITNGLNYTNNGYRRYLVPLTNFINLYDGDTMVDLSGTDNYNIVIDKYYKDDVLEMVKIDLSNYYLYKGISNDGVLTIDLYNVNKVSDFSLGYEIGVKR